MQHLSRPPSPGPTPSIWLLALMAGLGACGAPPGPAPSQGAVTPVEALSFTEPEPLHTPPGPGLGPDGGRLVPLPVVASWRYEAPAAARVLGWAADCGCVHLLGLPARLRPGDQGVLDLEVKPRLRPGRDQIAVRVHLMQSAGPHGGGGPLTSRFVIRRRGPPGPLFVPRRAHAGTLAPGDTLRVELDLLWDPAEVTISVTAPALPTAACARTTWQRWDATRGTATLLVEAPATSSERLDVAFAGARAEVAWCWDSALPVAQLRPSRPPP